MGKFRMRSIMASLKLPLLALAFCLFLCLSSHTQGKPKYFLVETKDAAADNNKGNPEDYIKITYDYGRKNAKDYFDLSQCVGNTEDYIKITYDYGRKNGKDYFDLSQCVGNTEDFIKITYDYGRKNGKDYFDL